MSGLSDFDFPFINNPDSANMLNQLKQFRAKTKAFYEESDAILRDYETRIASLGDSMSSHTHTKASIGLGNVEDVALSSRIGSTGPAGCRNKLHNPIFQIAQRGGSGTVANGVCTWLFDRWRTNVYNLPGCSLSVSPSSMLINGKPRKAMKITNGAAIASLSTNGGAISFMQGLPGRELVDMLGDSATIKCYIRASVAGTYPVALRVLNAAGTIAKTYVKKCIVAANTITEVSFAVATDSANWVCENTDDLGAQFSVGCVGGADFQAATADAWVDGSYYTATGCTNWLATAGATVEICMPQLVRGTVAGEFDCLSDQDELDRCRYFLPGVVSTLDTAIMRGMGLVVMSAATTAVCFVPFGRPARGEPTGIYTTGSIGIAAGNNAAAAATPLTVDPLSSRNIGVFDTTTSFSSAAGIAGSFYAIPNSLCRVLFTGLEI